jgi:hypothetical protein
MQTNVGFADRLIRIVLGVVVLSLPLFGMQTPLVFIALVPLGVVPLLTGLFGICPLYQMLGHNSVGRSNHSDASPS